MGNDLESYSWRAGRGGIRLVPRDNGDRVDGPSALSVAEAYRLAEQELTHVH